MSEGRKSEQRWPYKEWLGADGGRVCYITEKGLLDDSLNNWAFISGALSAPDIGISFLKEEGPIRSYQEYVGQQHAGVRGEEILAASSPDAIAAFDALVADYNARLSDPEVTADEIRAIYEQADALIFAS